MKGAKKYNKNLGYSISTYLMRCIQNEVLAYIRRENAYKTIPKKLIVSLNEKKKFLGDGEYELQDVVPSSFNLENYIENKNNVEKLYQCIKKLTEKEQIILIYSYGLFQKEKLRQKELSKILNISQAQVSRIRCKTIEKLRTMMDDDVI